MELHRYIDHTLLKPDATENDIIHLCHDAAKYNFYSVMVNPIYVKLARSELSKTEIKIGAVAGFPLGASLTGTKIDEAMIAEQDGADEIDTVANIGWLCDKKYIGVERELTQMKNALAQKTILKIIIETPLLPPDVLPDAIRVVINSGADYVKSATGFSGATPLEHILKMKELCGHDILIKAAGGIKTARDAIGMIKAGASRIGCSSSVAIIEQYSHSKK